MRVMRLQPGASLLLFDGQGSESVAELVALEASRAVVRAQEPRPGGGESALELHLIQALPVKLPRFDTIVRTCTELGVVSIQPLIAAHSQLPGGGVAVVNRRQERWNRIAETAAEQCGRARVPSVARACGFQELDWERLPSPRLLLQPGAPAALGARLLRAAPESATVMIGPEGGWSPAELEFARDQGAALVSTGPRILRADSAGVVALVLLQSIWGDLGGRGEGF